MRRITGLLSLFALAFVSAFGADAPEAAVKTLNTPRTFPSITNAAQWLERRREIREQILVSAGLWPMPEKTPLHAVISGKIERDGYSVENVRFQSYPGFYVGGNLYRPLGKGAGPFPATLDAHGHWVHGRLEDTDNCSAPGRCINFAKQGIIAFAYDMVGYNDTRFADESPDAPGSDKRPNHTFGLESPTNLLWSVTLMGLQTWDSIRALDFLESLPDVDKSRLAVTGASGGGTQTFILGAIDDRLAAQAPVNMVSHTMQGGCQCENMPGLRVEFNNMEIAACAAPRPQLMVAATGDWTKTMPTVEGPAVNHIYELFNGTEKLRYVQFDFEHNYNRTSREAVYQWFDKCLLDAPDQPVAEQPFKKEPDRDLLNFPDGKLPADAVTQQGLIDYLIKMHKEQLRKITPTDEASLANYKQVMAPAYSRTLEVEWLPQPVATIIESRSTNADWVSEKLAMAPPGANERIHLLHFTPLKLSVMTEHPAIILAHPDGGTHFIDNSGEPIGLAGQFLHGGFEIVVVMDAGRPADSKQTSIFYTTYNRTRLQERVSVLVSVCDGVTRNGRFGRPAVLCGCGRAGAWAMLAAPAADAVMVDCGQLDISDDQALLDSDLFCPGIRNIDTFEGALNLAVPHPLLLMNVGQGFPTAALAANYKLLHALKKIMVDSNPLTDAKSVEPFLQRNYGERY